MPQDPYNRRPGPFGSTLSNPPNINRPPFGRAQTTPLADLVSELAGQLPSNAPIPNPRGAMPDPAGMGYGGARLTNLRPNPWLQDLIDWKDTPERGAQQDPSRSFGLADIADYANSQSPSGSWNHNGPITSAAPPQPPAAPSAFRQQPPSPFQPRSSSQGEMVEGTGLRNMMFREPGPGVSGADPSQTGLRSTPTSGFRRPTEELYRMAYSQPQTIGGAQIPTTAPGAQQMALDELTQRKSLEGLSLERDQDELSTLQKAGTQLTPPVQAAEEAKAKRAAYPAQVAGNANQLVAMLGLQGRQATAQGAEAAKQTEARGRHVVALTNAKRQLLTNLATTNDVTGEDRQLLLQQISQIDKQIEALTLLHEMGYTDQDIEDDMSQDFTDDSSNAF